MTSLGFHDLVNSLINDNLKSTMISESKETERTASPHTINLHGQISFKALLAAAKIDVINKLGKARQWQIFLVLKQVLSLNQSQAS